LVDGTAFEILGVGSLRAKCRCRRLKVVPLCSYVDSSYSVLPPGECLCGSVRQFLIYSTVYSCLFFTAKVSHFSVRPNYQ